MLKDRRALYHILEAARALQAATKSENYEVAELHLLEAVKHTVRAGDAIMPVEGGGNDK